MSNQTGSRSGKAEIIIKGEVVGVVDYEVERFVDRQRMIDGFGQVAGDFDVLWRTFNAGQAALRIDGSECEMVLTKLNSSDGSAEFRTSGSWPVF